ncbi:MAG: hypothetical protein U5K79_19360 [Cyclobacteriaceae bacterium]|nr:hypothetical protein [Cyclobacteriaceae bacterium]
MKYFSTLQLRPLCFVPDWSAGNICFGVDSAMIENSRMPVDDPKTHLELTMVHEVMILDNSGFDLGVILYATPLKFAMYGAIHR